MTTKFELDDIVALNDDSHYIFVISEIRITKFMNTPTVYYWGTKDRSGSEDQLTLVLRKND